MMARDNERGASTSPLETIARERYPVVTEDVPVGRESLSTLDYETLRRHDGLIVAVDCCRLDFTRNVTTHNASALLDFPDSTGSPFLLPRAPTAPPLKSAAEAHRILVQTYGDNALSDTTCRDWFRRFKNNDFQLEDKERSGAPKNGRYTRKDMTK
ncbi:MOS1T transposase, partial [Pseudoatta argentina]